MRHLIILANVNGTRLDPPRVVQRSVLGSCDCRYVERRTPPRAPRQYIGKGAKHPNPLIAPRGRKAPSNPPKPQMCAECEDSAEGEIVLDTDRGGAYYSILRQARKRLSESRGAIPQAGTLRTGYWTDGITLNYQFSQ